ncbi:MAG TPA: methyltransferase [Gammaproteobacteria bacterium]|nr:methyltransferase [Gammaproteobacteria bacterium]
MRRLVVGTLAFMVFSPVFDAGAADPAVPAYVTAALAAPERQAGAAADYDYERHTAAIMTFIGVKPGQKVVELLPGGGYWTKVFSGIVGPSGHVYTIWADGYQQYVENSYARWQKLVATPTYSNVSLLRQADADFKVPEAVDVVFTNQNYHDYHDKFMGPVDMGAFDKKVFDALKPGGLFVVIDNVAPAGSGFADTDTIHRVDPEAVKKEVDSAGFVFDGESDALKNTADTHLLMSYEPPMAGHNDQFIFRFKKPMQ